MYVSTILFINISIASHHRPLLPFPSLPSETIVLIYDSICFLCVIVGWLGTLPLCSMWLCAGEDCPVLPHWRKRTWRKSKEKRECILRFSASKLYLLFFFLLLTNTHLRWENHRFRIGTSSSQNDVLDACLSCCKHIHTHTHTPSRRKWSHVIRMCEICSVFAQRTSCHLLRSGTRGFFFQFGGAARRFSYTSKTAAKDDISRQMTLHCCWRRWWRKRRRWRRRSMMQLQFCCAD